MIKGTIIKSTGSFYQVLDEQGKIWTCRITGKFRLQGFLLTNPVTVGDNIYFEPENAEDGIIKKIEPRLNYVARQSPHNRLQLHLLAVNIDQAIVVSTVREPALKTGFIDRFLLLTEPQNIPTFIVINKTDIYDQEDMEIGLGLKYLYEKIGYTVIMTSTVNLDGIEALNAIVRDKTTLIGGQSGVGKSSLLNAIEPGLGLRTGELSDYSGKGQHTTTFSEMFPLRQGGSIVDTPGIKSLTFNNLEIQDVAHNFREIFEYSAGCKYNNCTHRNEPKCAVKEAVDNNQISDLRYSSYLQILEEIENQNYWEIHKDI